MEYTIQSFAKLAGVSTRTLRYYDQIGLLTPARVRSNGYRIYGEKQVNLLQQILFYREMELGLPEIKEIVLNPEFDAQKALLTHHAQLLQKQKRLERLIETVEQTIEAEKGTITMTDKEKFAAFKDELVEQNEEKYGEELREKYGEKEIERSNKKVKGMSEADYAHVTALNDKLFAILKEMQIEATDELVELAVNVHKEWLSYFWPEYSKEAHIGLANMYVEDPRFTAYYDDRAGDGAAELLRDAVVKVLG
ncbi:transcriptional regulator [Listeria floridensis FSL S10-1187]|uniref:Transcriptional regulator n=1 Tax=Listeria floridensis FSL S10-1187 TaxID=1265817 RepID=A0ABN0RDK3_9LIST|nr:MerR family transcriptional regulator [Listeria floridensis]EUJ29139.1 transcriptional regulator [Listeria floridensis FSL S10-1187]